ncbi:MAG: hypothetical protein ACXW23_20615 [Telluria sp.]
MKAILRRIKAKVMSQAEAGEAAFQADKAQCESQWHDFEARVRIYFATLCKQIKQDVAAARATAWREAVDVFYGGATKFVATRRADLDAAVKRIKADAAARDWPMSRRRRTPSFAPAAETHEHRIPIAVLFRQVAPRRTGY